MWKDYSLGQGGNLTSQEEQVIALINGTSAYNYDLQLEEIAFNQTVSDYAFRVAGSPGANVTVNWITEQFESFGLEVRKEPFELTNWMVLGQPTLITDDDGNWSTTNDQIVIKSFQSTHYSWPTPEGGVYADLVVLPLPVAANHSEIEMNPINTTAWDAIDTTGKVPLIGKEVRWVYDWEETYKNKLSTQRPIAVVYTWWYDWMSFTPPMFSSAGGRPVSPWLPEHYYWDLKIPVGWVNYEDGLWIRNAEKETDLFANVTIESVIGSGLHYNVVGRLEGYQNPDNFVIVSGHYDTVMCSGFCDNGAGTAGVVEMARIFTEAIKKGLYCPKYTILFIAFAAEEIGLVGSINYVMQHKTEMKDIIAVINLDSIGSDNLSVAETNPGDEFDLDQLVLEAAQDLGISATLTEPGGADQETFRNPAWADGLYLWWWGLIAGIADAVPIESSTLLVSFPLYYSNKWDLGTPGYIHTPYDNSTSTETLNWVEADDLEDHIQVASLAVMRISPNENVLPSIGAHFREPEIVMPNQNVTVSVNVTDTGSGVREVILSCMFDNETSCNLTMSYNSATSLYEGTIPGQAADTTVKYKIIAYDKAGNIYVDDNERRYYVYSVVPEFVTWPVLFLMLFLITIIILAKRKRRSNVSKSNQFPLALH